MTDDELKRRKELEAKVKPCALRTSEEKAEYKVLREKYDVEQGFTGLKLQGGVRT